jgi:hypothetical protein
MGNGGKSSTVVAAEPSPPRAGHARRRVVCVLVVDIGERRRCDIRSA